MKKLIMLTVVFLAVLAAAYAQKPAIVGTNEEGWQKIGEITASFKMQSESIMVLGADEFESIKLKVTDAPIHIERLQVFYESGDMEEVEVDNELQAGGETRAIELKQPERDISKVAFTYKTLPNFRGEKAHVELHGLKTERQGKDNEDANYRRDRDNDAEEAVEDAEREVKEEAREAEQAVEDEAAETEAEVKEEANEAERDAEETSESVGDGAKKSAAILGAEIDDKVYEDKIGPNGEKVYIDDNGKFYYINDKGDKVYATKIELKDNPKKDKDNKDNNK